MKLMQLLNTHTCIYTRLYRKLLLEELEKVVVKLYLWRRRVLNIYIVLMSHDYNDFYHKTLACLWIIRLLFNIWNFLVDYPHEYSSFVRKSWININFILPSNISFAYHFPLNNQVHRTKYCCRLMICAIYARLHVLIDFNSLSLPNLCKTFLFACWLKILLFFINCCCAIW